MYVHPMFRILDIHTLLLHSDYSATCVYNTPLWLVDWLQLIIGIISKYGMDVRR